MSNFDPHSPCRTKIGRAVEIIAVLPPEKAPHDGHCIVALVEGINAENGPTLELYSLAGRFHLNGKPCVWDLENSIAPARTAAEVIAALEGAALAEEVA